METLADCIPRERLSKLLRRPLSLLPCWDTIILVNQVPNVWRARGRRCSWSELHVSRDIEHVSKRGVRVWKHSRRLMAAAKLLRS